MRSTLFTLLLFLAASYTVQAQTTVPKEPSNWFDFWVGNWELTWESNGVIGKGTNTIERTLNGKVLQENFTATEGAMKGYVGKSWSVYNKNTNTWHQTWVDNQGAYLDFTGKRNGNRLYFQRSATNPKTDLTTWQRMTFYNIEADRFTWDWEKSTDNGETWELAWRINYVRIK